MNPYLTTKQMQNSTNLIFSLIKKSPPQNFIRQSLGKLKNGRNLPPNQTNTIGSIISLLLQLGLLKIGAWEMEWSWWWCHGPGTLEGGCQGGGAIDFLTDQLTLFQTGGRLCPPHYYSPPLRIYRSSNCPKCGRCRAMQKRPRKKMH